MNQQWLRDIELLLRNGQKEKAASKITRHSSVKDGELDILLAQFLLSYYNCRLEQALTAADASLQAARKAGDNLAEAYALNNRGNSLRMLDRCDEALAAADASLEIARAIGDKLSEANALNNKGITLRMLNRYDEALAAADASLEAARKANDKRTEAYALNNKADTLRMLDRYDEALGSANDSLAVAQGAGDKLAETYALQRMILCQSELGMNDERKESLRQLKIIDPGLAERLETYPVRPRRDDAKPTRPSFDGMLQEIYNKTKSDEKKMRGVLHTEAVTPKGLPKDSAGVFVCLRNWASYSTIDLMRPLPGDSSDRQNNIGGGPGGGGGYFLWWRGWGLVIDPGLGFGQAFRAAGFVPRNINAVVATHHHIDHTGDMLPILTCVFEMNEPPLPQDRTAHEVDLVFSPGAYGVFAGLVPYIRGVRSVKHLSPSQTIDFSLPAGARATMKAIQAEHKDLTGRTDASIGLRIELSVGSGDGKCIIGITGDTRLVDGMAEGLSNSDLIVIHIGSVYEYDFSSKADRPWHLGFSGVVRLLEEIKEHSRHDWDPLVLVSEWGEELGPHRSVICEEVREKTGIRRVFPAECYQGVALKQNHAGPLCSRKDGRFANHWQVGEGGISIEYLCSHHDHGL